MIKVRSENRKVEEIGILLAKDFKNNPLGDFINSKKLDFSVDSLKEVDKYLEKIRKNKKKLSEEEIKKIILRCGTYAGEVIRKTSLEEFIWISYETACRIDRSIINLERSILTHLVLYDAEKGGVWFPLNKVYKFLESGNENNLWAFAVVCLEEHER